MAKSKLVDALALQYVNFLLLSVRCNQLSRNMYRKILRSRIRIFTGVEMFDIIDHDHKFLFESLLT